MFSIPKAEENFVFGSHPVGWFSRKYSAFGGTLTIVQMATAAAAAKEAIQQREEWRRAKVRQMRNFRSLELKSEGEKIAAVSVGRIAFHGYHNN